MNSAVSVINIQKALQVAGMILVLASLVFIYGWFQTSDPDCILETNVLAQIRLCGKEYVDQPAEPPIWLLLASLAALGLGVFCIRFNFGKSP